MRKLLTSVLLCVVVSLFAQQSEALKSSLEQKFNNYYHLERENIHAHFSKSTYFTDEKIWLSGYVFTQQTRLPSIFTNNVFVEILDQNGKLVTRHLLFSTNGIFQATLPIPKDLQSGTYYFRFYTNYMNNFSEDLSSTYPVDIINIQDGKYDFKKSSKYADLYIDANPESGVFLVNTSNVIGVKVSDHQGRGVAVKNGKVLDDKNNVVASFSTNSKGYGRFEIADTKHINYRIEVENKGFTFSETLPYPTNSGIGLSVVNYTSQDKTMISIKSSSNNFSENYYLLINQNQNLLLLPLPQENKSILINNEMLFSGVNTARIIDEQQNVIAERVFFVHKTKSDTDKTTNNTEEIAIYSYATYDENSQVIPEHNIYNSIYVNPYIQGFSTYSQSYFVENNRSKNYDLDLFFLNQKPKENYKNIVAESKPDLKFNFERGLNLEATINDEIRNKKDYRIKMVSYPYLNEFTRIKDNNTFSFENLILADSIQIHFYLLNKEGKPKELPVSVRVLGNHKKFNKSFHPTIPKEGKHKIDLPASDDFTMQFPGLKNHYIIEEVVIEGSRLKREKQNGMLRGYKPEDVIGFENMKVLDFLITKNFHVERSVGATIVYSSYKPGNNLGRGLMIPQIFIDGSPQTEHSYLETIWMNQVDEIYLDRNYIIPGLNSGLNGGAGSQGLVRIYLKNPGMRFQKKEVKKTVQILGGFAKFTEFENTAFLGDDQGFELFGNLHWESRINAPKGKLKFNVPHRNKKNTKILVEGITSDGQIFSEIRDVDTR